METYGKRIVITGGVDVRALSSNKRAAIEREVREKLRITDGNRYIYHSDHSIPCDVSLDSYLYAMELIRRYGGYS